MRLLFSLTLAALLCIVTVNAADAGDQALFEKRQASKPKQAQIVETAKSDPVAAAKMVLQIKDIDKTDDGTWNKYANISGNADAKQVPWAKGVEFQQSPSANLVDGESFSNVPKDFYMFERKEWEVKDKHGRNGTQPYYINKGLNAGKVKRAVLVVPGYYRDSWNYINMFGNAYNIAKDKHGVEDGTVLIASLMVLNQKDKETGAVKDDWLYYKDGGWSVAGMTHGPGDLSISSFKLMDMFISKILGEYPGIETVVVAGHSLGAQAVMRYAAIKGSSHDDKLKFWIGNPGTYVYLNSKRPLSTDDCASYYDFPNGIDKTDTLPAYAGGKSADQIRSAYLARSVTYALGLDDNGVSSYACDSMAQGHNRLERSAYYIEHLESVNGGSFPSSHHADYLEGLSHQDYPTIAADVSINRIFIE